MWFCCSICHINDTFVLDVEIWGIALFLDSGVNYAYSYVLGTISKLSLLLFVSHNTFSQSWSRGSWYSLTMGKEPRKTGKGWIRWSRSSDLAFFFSLPFSFELLVLVLCVIIILCNKDKRENENPYLHFVELTLPSGMAINFVKARFPPPFISS